MFACNVCGKEFKVKVNLKAHVESQCGTAPQYICQICGKAFLTKWALINHGLVHSGKKAFLCRFCGKSYRLKVEVQRHERSHTGEKPFICKVCGKAFCHRESLVTHSTLHTGIRRYLCEICGYTFSCIGNLVKHHRRRRCTQTSKQFTGDELRQSTQTSGAANFIVCTSDQNAARSENDEGNTENFYQVFHTTSDTVSSNLQPNTIPDSGNVAVGDKNSILETNNNRISNKEQTVHFLPAQEVLDHTIGLAYNHENKFLEVFKKYKETDQMTQELGSMLSNSDSKSHNKSHHCNLEAAVIHNQQSSSLVHNYELFPLSINSTTQQQNVSVAKDKHLQGSEINTANFEREIPAKNEHGYSLTLYFHRSSPELNEDNIKVSVDHSDSALNIDTNSEINISSNVNTTEVHKSSDAMILKSATGKHFFQDETEGILLEGNGKENNSDNLTIDKELNISSTGIVAGGHSAKTAAHKQSSLALNRTNQINDKHLQQRIPHEICCNMQFDNLYQLKKHRKSHAREKKNSLQCTHCDKRYTNKTCLVKHETQHAVGVVPCNICKEEFLTKTEHHIHCTEQHNSKQHDARKPRLYICDICGKSFRQKGNLKVHMDSQCGSEPKNVCTVCGKTFLTSGSLSTHLLLHTGKKTFLCRFCGKSYQLKVQMQRHERCHTGEKPFVCKICGKAFGHRESLVTHGTLHTGIRPYMCEACGCRFSCIGNLVKHKQKQSHNRKCDNANQIVSR